MSGRRFSPWEDQLIREHYGKRPAREIGAMMDRSYTAVTIRAGRLGLSYQRHFPSHSGHVSTRWTEEEINALRKYYRVLPIAELCRKFNRTKAQLLKKASLLGLRRRTPHYEGRVVVEMNSDGTVKRVSLIRNGRKVRYTRVVWERFNGPVPHGMRVVVKTGNPLDCRHIENLELISDRMAMLRNNSRLTQDEAIAYDIIGAIKQKIKE